MHLVNISRLRAKCIEASLLIANGLPFARINHTLHGILHHSCELIERNDGFVLGIISEEALESANKHIYVGTWKRCREKRLRVSR